MGLLVDEIKIHINAYINYLTFRIRKLLFYFFPANTSRTKPLLICYLVASQPSLLYSRVLM